MVSPFNVESSELWRFAWFNQNLTKVCLSSDSIEEQAPFANGFCINIPLTAIIDFIAQALDNVKVIKH